MKNIRLTYLLFGILFLLSLDSYAAKKVKEVIVIHERGIPRSEKEAILILPGLGDSNKGRKAQKDQFGSVSYDLFIPNYIDRDSYENTMANLATFFEEQKLGEYDKIHVFSYILGSWVINKFIQDKGPQNIATIVYDRSPLQEWAPRLVVEKIPRIGKWYVGKVVFDFNGTPYPQIEKGNINIGILVESKATLLVRIFKKTVKSYEEVDWKEYDFQQEYDDLAYTRLNHDEIYTRFDVEGDNILHFMRNGRFLDNAKRTPFDWDPYTKYKRRDGK